MKIKFRDHGGYHEKIALTIVMLAFLLNPVSGAVIDISNSSALPDASSYTLINLSGMNNFGAVAIDLYYNGSVVSVTSASLGFSGHGVSLTSNINNTIGKARFLISTTDIPGPNSPLILMNVSLKAAGSEGQISTLGLVVPTLADTDGSSPASMVVNNGTFIILPSATPPASITNLVKIHYGPDHINWTWVNPSDSDFHHAEIYLNDIFKANISAPHNFYNATGLIPDTLYKISIYTVDEAGNKNGTKVEDSVRTLPLNSILPPIAICGSDKLKCENVASPVQFNAASSHDPDGSIISYFWEFGDGTTGTGVAPTHKYSAYRWNGFEYNHFTVNLTVTDNYGLINSTYQKVIIWKAGDVNGDGKVNIIDASIVGFKWGGSDPCADLNNDGKVNIIDVSMIRWS